MVNACQLGAKQSQRMPLFAVDLLLEIVVQCQQLEPEDQLGLVQIQMQEVRC